MRTLSLRDSILMLKQDQSNITFLKMFSAKIIVICILSSWVQWFHLLFF